MHTEQPVSANEDINLETEKFLVLSRMKDNWLWQAQVVREISIARVDTLEVPMGTGCLGKRQLNERGTRRQKNMIHDEKKARPS